ncbi:tumor protein 63-like isoform X3 [Bacillus rossius redtenbacheri]
MSKSKMGAQGVIPDLVKLIRVKEETAEILSNSVADNGEALNYQVKTEKDYPADDSTSGTCYGASNIKTEVNHNYMFYNDQISSEGEEFLDINDVKNPLRTNTNGAFQQFQNHPNRGFAPENISFLNGRSSHVTSVQEERQSSQSRGDFCECDVCGSFFRDTAGKNSSDRSRGSANMCPLCRIQESNQTIPKLLSTSTFSPTCRHPCVKKWFGQYDFNVCLCTTNQKMGCTFSPLLNKLFTVMNYPIGIQFKCSWARPDLYVRAVPVFLNDVAEPVVRCLHHMRPSEETNTGFPHVDHVIRCEHDTCSYERDESSGRLSVVAPLGSPPPGSDVVSFLYRFMCKTSCQGSMNRRPIQVVFTLETPDKEVVGRDTLLVRVCSCPVRDMRKEECRNTTCADKLPLRTGNLPALLQPCELCKKPRLEEDGLTYIPVYGDSSVVKKAASLLRANLIGEKLAEGLELTKKDKMNWKIFNQLICDGAGPSGS